MYCISDQQIDFIRTDLRARGISTESLQNDLLDHVCILIEQGLEQDGDFEPFYSSAIRSFYRQELFEIEEETRFLLTYKKHWVFSRVQFFGLLMVVLTGPFIGYTLLCMWMVSLGQNHEWNITGQGWDGTLIFALSPLLVLSILFLTPDRFDPLIPQKAKILVGLRPFIKIVPAESFEPDPSIL